MHELGICDALLKTVDGIVKDEKLEGVNRVVLEIGMLSGVLPAYMADCWKAVTDGTAYEDTVLEIETVRGVIRCEDCGREFSADLDRLLCPGCGGNRLTPLTGRDLTVKEIEAY